MSKLRDAAQQALIAMYVTQYATLDQCPKGDVVLFRDAITALEAALAEQPAEQAPVAWWHRKSNTFTSGNLVSNFAEWAPLYTAPPPAVAMPEGYALVPVEPTQAMLDAAGMCIVPEGKKWLDDSNRETWTAMLAAAPEAPEAPQLTIPPGYKLVPIQKLTANTSGVQIWTHERAHGIGEQP